jgi:hypothetical protein
MIQYVHVREREREAGLLHDRRLPPIGSSLLQDPWDSRPLICAHSPYVTSSLTRGRVGHSQLLLVLASAVIFKSESRGIHDHILRSQILDSPNLEGQVPVFLSPRNGVARFYPQTLVSIFSAFYISQGYGDNILPRLHTGYIWKFWGGGKNSYRDMTPENPKSEVRKDV